MRHLLQHPAPSNQHTPSNGINQTPPSAIKWHLPNTQHSPSNDICQTPTIHHRVSIAEHASTTTRSQHLPPSVASIRQLTGGFDLTEPFEVAPT
jgi:hypothetical protein